MFGKAPSPPPAPLSPARSSLLQRPPLSSLPSLVDVAIREVRIYRYPVPRDLEELLWSEELLHSGHKCNYLLRKHPWMNLEERIWQLLPSAVWTTDPARATFFMVPHAPQGHQCAHIRQVTTAYFRNGLARWLDYVVHALPYYNRSGGRDHVIVSNFENGPKCDCTMRGAWAPSNYSAAFDVLMSMVKIGHWAHRDAAMFGWKPGFDIAMPQFGAVPNSFGPYPPSQSPSWQEVVAKSNKTSFGFSGSFWGTRITCPATIKHAPEGSLGSQHGCECSPGVRTWLQDYMKRNCDSAQNMSSRCASLERSVRPSTMGSFWYALCPAAWACWSSRLYDAIDRLVVPAIMADGAIQPFEDILDWHSFSITLSTEKLMYQNNTSQLDLLHREATAASQSCESCPTCQACTKLHLVRRVRNLEQVRPWFLYNGTSPYNAIGLFLVELHCRQVHLRDSGDGVCKRYHARQAILRSVHDVHGRRHMSENEGMVQRRARRRRT